MTEQVDALAVITEYREGLKAAVDALPAEDIQALIQAIESAYEEQRHVFVIGNGGSAATASHMACDLAKTVLGANRDPQIKRFRVIALTDNMPLITAYGNDVGYETVFSEPLCNLANAGDLLIVITGSGNSPNIVEAVKTARDRGLRTVGMLGFAGGLAKPLVDHAIVVESDNYGYIEDAHMILVHLVTQYFKQFVAAAHGCGAEMGRSQ